MSWEATAWAARQVTGSAASKLTLLALANYADSNGICWPTQETLARDTEQSIDTVQRRLKLLVALGLVCVETRAGRRGQWDGKTLPPRNECCSNDQAAICGTVGARDRARVHAGPCRTRPGHRAAPGPVTIPHSYAA
jgi:DNA-binding transcriptional MocR family regulator